MRRTILWVAGLVVVVVSSIACEGRVSIGARCSTDGECGELSCRFGRCRAECARASDCPGAGAVCVGEPGLGVCTIPAIDTCAGGCESGLVCALAVCSTACTTSDECLSGATCEPTSGACVVAPSTTVSVRRTLCAGAAHVCATHDGIVYCWGRNNGGQVGDGMDDFNPSTHAMNPDGADSSPTPRAVQTATGDLADIVELACGETFTTALSSDGRVFSWGTVGDGGLGSAGRGGHIAVEIPGLAGVDHIASGRYHTCARIGTSYQCWGRNSTVATSDDRLGTDTMIVDSVTPLPAPAWEGAIDLALGGHYTCALFATGVQCRGDNVSGVMGDMTTFGPVPTSAAISGTAAATRIGSGAFHACVLVDGDPWCWGGGDHGEIGESFSACSGLSARCSGTPVRVVDPLGRTYTFLTHGYAEGTCAISTEGQVVCWGGNAFGSSGGPDPDTSLYAPGDPIMHAGAALIGMVEVTRSGDVACARDASGTVFCWGRTYSGQLGCGAIDTDAHPVACNVVFP